MRFKQPLYEKRHKLVSQIPNFWPLVIEQAPTDIDEFIQPSDSALLLSSLVSLTVTRFEIENGGKGDPRSVCFTWEFGANDYFEDKVIEKKFWYRRSKGGWTGLVSEPVEIQWKKGKDLTGGLLSMVKKVWEAEQAKPKTGSASKTLTPDQKSLKKKIENTGLGGLSFFAWFAYVGRNVSAEENRVANEKVNQDRLARQQANKGNLSASGAQDDDEDQEDDEDDDDNDLEIFPEGENLAIALSEDLWPNAIKYFSKDYILLRWELLLIYLIAQAQEQDDASDDDFESDEDEADNDGEDEAMDEGEGPPTKKVKT